MTGQYAFLFSGFDKDGVYQVGGTLTSDGKGKLISGIEDDANSHGGPKTSAFRSSGTYSMGGDNRGVLTHLVARWARIRTGLLSIPSAQGGG